MKSFKSHIRVDVCKNTFFFCFHNIFCIASLTTIKDNKNRSAARNMIKVMKRKTHKTKGRVQMSLFIERMSTQL